MNSGKKFISTVAVLAFFISALHIIAVPGDADARAIGIKGGWAMMQDDYDAADWDDAATLGIYFDMGKFIFNNLNFRPGVDYLKTERDAGNSKQELTIWGIHLDWYWHFMGKSNFSPYLGFGAALNVFDDNDNTTDDDSDAGLEGFFGADIGLTGSVGLMVEGRYCFNDIANWDQNIAKVLVGVSFSF